MAEEEHREEENVTPQGAVPTAEPVSSREDVDFKKFNMTRKGEIPWALPFIERATNENERNQLRAVLEPFQSFRIETKRVVGKGSDTVRDYFASAVIPGMNEVIPILGFQEKRTHVEGKLALLSVVNYIFTGEEKKTAGFCHFHTWSNKDLIGYDFYSNEFRRIQGASFRNSEAPVVTNEYGDRLFVYRAQTTRSTKSSMLYHVHEVETDKVIANVTIRFKKPRFGEKTFLGLELNLIDIGDNDVKYPVLTSVLMLVYLNKFL